MFFSPFLSMILHPGILTGCFFMKMRTAYIGLGSNLGDRQSHIRQAVERLSQEEGVMIQRVSPFYETAAAGFQKPAPPFLNGVAELAVECTPQHLLNRLLHIESQLGRIRRPQSPEENGPQSRSIDLDLLLYGDQIISEQNLILPHPRLHLRWFVLKPLSDLCPARPLPGLGLTVAEALQALDAHSAIIGQRVDWMAIPGNGLWGNKNCPEILPP